MNIVNIHDNIGSARQLYGQVSNGVYIDENYVQHTIT